MFDQILDTFRKATESTLQMQQQMFQKWTQQWPQVPGMPMMPMMPVMPGMSPASFSGPWVEQVQAYHKQMATSVNDLLKKHRDQLETQYTAGIRTIEEAFRLGEAKDPDQLRRLTEELWKQSFDCLKTVSEGQIKEFQAAVAAWFENLSKGAAAMKS
jgi:hypothetical protein